MTSSPCVSAEVNGPVIQVDPLSVNAQANLAEIQLTFVPTGDLFDPDEHLSENVRVVVDSGSGNKEFRFPAGSVPSAQNATVALGGELSQYPFDTHTGMVFVTVDTYTKNSDGSIASKQIYIPDLSVITGVNGWDTIAERSNTAAAAYVGFTFSRAFSTQAFAIMLLALAVILAATMAWRIGLNFVDVPREWGGLLWEFFLPRWFEWAIDWTAAAGARWTGGHVGAFAVADWIDPATGEPAEGACPPRRRGRRPWGHWGREAL